MCTYVIIVTVCNVKIDTASILVFEPGESERPEIITQPQSEVRLQAGQELRLVVVAHARDQLSYQWFCESRPLPYGTQQELLISQVTPEDSGTYTCRVSSATGGSVMSSHARVLVSPLQPAFPPQPVLQQGHPPPEPVQQPYFDWAQQQMVQMSPDLYNGGASHISKDSAKQAFSLMTPHPSSFSSGGPPPPQQYTRYVSERTSLSSSDDEMPQGQGSLLVVYMYMYVLSIVVWYVGICMCFTRDPNFSPHP